MKFTATALVAALSMGTGLASVIQAPLYAREPASSTSLLQRRSPLEDMDPLDALRLVLLRRAAAGSPPPKSGGAGGASGAGGADKKSGGGAGQKSTGGGSQGKGQGATPANKGDSKSAGSKKQDDPWVPPSVKGKVDKDTLKCNDKTHECSGEIIVG